MFVRTGPGPQISWKPGTVAFRPHPDFDTFPKVICEEWIFIKTQIKKHLAKLKTFKVAKKAMVEKEERINRIVFKMVV